MKPIDRGKVYIFFWGKSPSPSASKESRRVDLSDISGQVLGSIYFYPSGVQVPNDSYTNGKIFMHRPLSDYEDILSFIQRSPGDVYFNFDHGGNNFGYVSNHLY